MARGRPFEKGQKRSPNAGRKKGSLNKATKEFKAFWREFFESEEYRENLKNRVLKSQANHMESYIAQLLFGKPKDVVLHEGGVNLQVNDAAESFRGRILRLVARSDQGEGARQAG